MRIGARKRWLLLSGAGLLLFCSGMALLVFFSDSVGKHPVFGRIRLTMAADLNAARPDPLGKFLRKHLPAKIVSARGFPYRFKDQPRYLEIDGLWMEWSIGSAITGWLYFHEPATMPRSPAWEFAPSSATNLLDLTSASLPSRFYAYNDPDLQTVFGFTATTNAVELEEGKIIFARHLGKPRHIYILHLFQQTDNSLVVHYCISRS